MLGERFAGAEGDDVLYVDPAGHTVVTERWRLIETAKTVEA